MAEGLLYRRRVWTRTPPRGVIVSPSGSGLARGLVFAHDFGAGDIGGLPLLGPPAGPWTASSASTDQTRERGTKTETNGYFHAYAPWNRDAIENGFTSLLLARYITRAAASNFILGDVSTGASDYNWGHYISNGTNGYAFFVRNNSGAAVNTIQSSIFVGDGFYALGGRYNKSTGKVTGAVNGVLSAEVSQSGTVAKTALKYSANLWWTTSYLSLIYYRHFLWDRPLSDNELINATRSPWQLYAPANSPIFYSLPGGGSTYPVSLTANGTISASDIRSIRLIRSASSTNSASMTRVRALLRSASATATASASAAKHVSLARTATATGTASVSKVRALLSSMSASSTVSASLSKVMAIARTITASATITAARVRVVGLIRSANTTASATRTRIVGLTRGATATATASLAQVKAVLRTLSATATASAALARDLRRLVTVTVTATAIRSRAISVARTASSTATAVRSRIVRLARSASATASAALTTVKQTARLLSTTATATATLAKLLQKRLIATGTIQAVLTIVSSAAQQGQIAVDRLRIRIMPAIRAIRRFRDG